MNIKYIGNGPEKGKVHVKESNKQTGCGARIDDNPQDWVTTTEPVTCEKNGCKNHVR
ncbi:MAG TPA: hypothetical protein IAD34_08570 [Candidatus Scatovicinus merdipullorum]|nr:hypothetical protein [Candidatus Scatovicinus merdipullorum]